MYILIEPVGIETVFLRSRDDVYRILIEPVGIETLVFISSVSFNIILIEPVGIETQVRELSRGLHLKDFNRTSWN